MDSKRQYTLTAKIRIKENTEDVISSLDRYNTGFNLEFTDEGNGMILSGDECWSVYLHLFDKSIQSDFVEYLKNWFRNNPDKLEKDVKIVVEL